MFCTASAAKLLITDLEKLKSSPLIYLLIQIVKPVFLPESFYQKLLIKRIQTVIFA